MTQEAPNPKQEDHGETPLAPPTTSPMPAWQRRVVLGMLLGLLAFLSTLQPQYGHFSGPEWWSWDYVFMGYVLLALPCLLAAWAAFRRQPLAVRVPRAVGVAACLGLLQTWLSSDFFPAWVLFYPIEVLFLIALLAIVRRRAGWRIGLEHEWADSEAEGNQFSLRQMLLWTAATAVILSLDRWMASGKASQDEAWWAPVLELTIFGGVGAFWLLLAVPCVGFCLCPGSRRRFAAWMAGLGLFVFLLIFALGFWLMYVSNGASPSEIPSLLADTAVTVGTVLLGFLLAVWGVLGVVQLCGYRLVRTKAPAVAAPVSCGPRPVWRTPFPYLVAAMGLVALAFVWPAVRIAEGRKQAWADLALEQKFAEYGVSAMVSQGRLLGIDFAPNQSIPDAALQLVQENHEHCSVSELDLSNRQVSDAQLAYLADVPLLLLNLAGNPVTDQGLAQLKYLKGLNSLDLSKTQITDEGLKLLLGCENLQELYLDGTPITDAGLQQLAALKNLQAISVANTAVTAQGTAELLRALPNCRVLPSSPMPVPAITVTRSSP